MRMGKASMAGEARCGGGYLPARKQEQTGAPLAAGLGDVDRTGWERRALCRSGSAANLRTLPATALVLLKRFSVAS